MCGILPDQGLNPCPLHWQADSLPLVPQGSPASFCLWLVVGGSEELVPRSVHEQAGFPAAPLPQPGTDPMQTLHLLPLTSFLLKGRPLGGSVAEIGRDSALLLLLVRITSQC